MEKDSGHALLDPYFETPEDQDSASAISPWPYTERHQRNRPYCLASIRIWLWVLIVVVPWCISGALMFYIVKTTSWGHDRFRQPKTFPSQMTYSPAQDEVEYEVRVFEQNLEDAPLEFRHPGTVDQAWSDLYSFGMSAISMNDASKLTNYTTRLSPGQPEYTIQLDVFHQLHCLNALRQGLEPYYGMKNESWHRLTVEEKARFRNESPKHASHIHIDAQHINYCLNSLRNSIMCHSDVSTVVWHWDQPPDSRKAFNRGFLTVPHTCRNFERIRDWGRSRTTENELDLYTRPPDDDIVIPTFP